MIKRFGFIAAVVLMPLAIRSFCASAGKQIAIQVDRTMISDHQCAVVTATTGKTTAGPFVPASAVGVNDFAFIKRGQYTQRGP